MKRRGIGLLTFIFLALTQTMAFSQSFDTKAEEARKNYGNKITVLPKDGSVTISEDRIVLAPKKQGSEYTISGYFKGQIVNKTKNTLIRLKNAYLENTNGEACIYGEAKTEIASAKGSVNYLLSSGTSVSKTAALQSKKNLEVGGSGTIYVIGKSYHGIKGDDVKFKGSGNIYSSGTDKGSAVNCKSFTVSEDKTFTAYLFDSKNGIKADGVINIASGNFYFYGNGTALKTDTAEDNPEISHGIEIKHAVLHTKNNKVLQETSENAFKNKAIILEDKN